jgi:hypothetical protein
MKGWIESSEQTRQNNTMTTIELPAFIRENYEIYEWRHSCAILQQDFAQEYEDICDILMRFRLKKVTL